MYARLGRHLNILQLLGSAAAERMLVLEHCLYGNCRQGWRWIVYITITVSTIVRDYILANKHRFLSQVEPATGELLGAGVQDLGDQGGGELSTRCLLQWCLGISKVTSLAIFIYSKYR